MAIDYSKLVEITVTNQSELDDIPDDFKGHIYIKCTAKVVVNKRYFRRVEVRGGSVVARDNSSVVARGSSFVEARDKSSIIAQGNSSVEACDNSSVEAWGSCFVEARDKSSIVLEQRKGYGARTEIQQEL